MSHLLDRLNQLEELAKRLVAEVETLREAKRELTEENAELREQAGADRQSSEAWTAERKMVVERVERLVEGIDGLLEETSAAD